MSNPVIKVKVKTSTLLSEQPRGGKLSNRSIVIMDDNQPDSKYDDSDGGKYKDKLHTYINRGDDIYWEISDADGSNVLEMTECQYDANFLKLLIAAPQPVAGNKSQWMAQVKTDATGGLSSKYTYSFCLKSNPRVIWTWDPYIESRP